MPAVSTATTRSVGRRRQTFNARSRGRQSTGGAVGTIAIWCRWAVWVSVRAAASTFDHRW